MASKEFKDKGAAATAPYESVSSKKEKNTKNY
jgi:hypothetical protein